jgi:hypothetical protein
MSFSRPLALSSLAALVATVGLATACGDDLAATPTAGDAGPDAVSTADAGGGGSDAGDGGDGGARRGLLTIGDGHAPGLAVDATGTAYIAWYGPESTTTTLQYCRLPRTAAGCDVRTSIPAPGTSITRPFVTVSGASVRVISYRYGLAGERFGAAYLFSSTDGGATFDGGRMMGSLSFSDATVGPGDAISFATSAVTEGELYELAPASGTTPPAQYALLSTTHPHSGTVALLDPTTPIVAFADGSGNAQFRRYSGTGDPNVAASWSPAQDIGNLDYMHLAAGSKGLFLKGRTAGRTLEVRRFDGSTFAPGVAIPEGTGELPQSHLFQDPGGRLHAVWPRIDVDGIRLYHATSDDGTRWVAGRLLTGDDAVHGMRVATAADHVGVTTWEAPPGAIRVLDVGPLPPQ